MRKLFTAITNVLIVDQTMITQYMARMNEVFFIKTFCTVLLASVDLLI